MRCANTGYPLTDLAHGRQPCLTVIETDDGEVLGCLTPHVWKTHRGNYGDMSRGMLFRFHPDFNTGEEIMTATLLPNAREFHSMYCDGHEISIRGPGGTAFHVDESVKVASYEGRAITVKRLEVWALVKPGLSP